MTAHRPKKILGFAKGLVFLGGKHLAFDELGSLFDTVHIFPDPVERLQVAQPAFALFDVGFNHIALAALLAVPLGALIELGFDKVGRSGLEQVLPQLFTQITRQARVTGKIAVFNKAGADCVIVGGKAQAVFDRAAGVPDLQLQIPQDIEHRFDHAFGPRGDFIGRQKQQIDIGLRRHFAAPVAAHGDQRQALAFGRVGQRVQIGGGDIQSFTDQVIGQIAIGAGRGARVKRGRFKGCLNRVAPDLLGGSQDIDRRAPDIARIRERGVGRVNGAAGLHSVKNRRRRTNQIVRRGHVCVSRRGFRNLRDRSFLGLVQGRPPDCC